ncbi:MAG: FHA domain-containing protein [Planctomycetes bacterium]|nr:FHA domain-containing protein [Planctomycetota bacterium]
MAIFRVTTGDQKGKIYALQTDKIVIGRESKDLPISDQGVSRQHAEVFRIGELFFIRDLESRNGTFVNDSRVADQEILRAGDRVYIGNTEMVFEDRFARQSDSRVLRFGDSIDKPEATISFRLPTEDATATLKSSAGAKVAPPPRAGIADGEEHAQLATLYKVSRWLGTVSDTNEAMNLVAREMANALNADHVYLFVFDDDSPEEFRLVAEFDRQPVTELAVSRSILQRVRREGRPVLSSDAMLDDRFAASESIVMKRIKSLLCVPLMVMSRAVGAFYATNAKLAEVFSADDLALATTIGMLVGNYVEMKEILENQGHLYRNALKIIADAAAMRMPETKGRAERVAMHASAIARGAGFAVERARTLWVAGLLHDVGVMGMSEDEIADAEQNAARRAKLTVELLATIPELSEILPAVRYHTERFDGSGYPQALAGDEIPIEAEIVGLARELESLLSHGGEGGGELPAKEALIRVRDMAGKQFSTRAVNALLIAYRKNYLFQEDARLFHVGL